MVAARKESSCGSDEKEELYEKIEAPKWVDFTTPEKTQLANDYEWFCLRAGSYTNVHPDSKLLFCCYSFRFPRTEFNPYFRLLLCRFAFLFNVVYYPDMPVYDLYDHWPIAIGSKHSP